MNEEKKNNYKFKYVFEDNYNPKYVNGAFGGVNPQGEINLNFYMERFAIPKTEKLEINEVNTITNITHEPEDVENRFIRFIECGIIMNKERAQEIYEFLGDILSKNTGE